MTDPCTPPPGTKDGSWHVLKNSHGTLVKWQWAKNCWWYKHNDYYTVAGASHWGWTYIGPVEANTPTGIPADWADCAQCGARRFYPSGQCMQYCDKKPSPPDAKDALLREALKWLGVETPMVGWAEIELENLRVRIHQQLEGK